MKKEQRLSKTTDFQTLYHKGVKVCVSGFVLYGMETVHRFHRLGIVVSRKIGNAVVRNQLKRRVRVLYNDLDRFLHSPMDIVVIATRSQVAKFSFLTLEQCLFAGFQALAQRYYAH